MIHNDKASSYSYDKYKDFTLSLAIVDAVPVILFSITCAVIGSVFNNILFSLGAILTILGGMCKVLWKVLLATIHKDVRFLNRPLFIVLMPAGFALMLISFVIKGQDAGWNNISAAIFSFPAVIFFSLGILGLCAMTIFFKKHDKTDVKNNWTEQLTNCFAQAMILVGVIIACY
ncbi:hypothetical protein SAMN04487884_13225 [Butyrivibrio fibrisolvens]|uniref:Uncharacterized protein n=1 Tax=Butyrivibrio fibrisolvens TaxID=831 RepID=A0A1H9WNU0_BUTFI|nr:hypothetical protein [Butyrivibrio fibrisolvens]SES35570.1 hypothetical protein SAMN04487884_13225 [Butyrivibrio fibrisolvens]